MDSETLRTIAETGITGLVTLAAAFAGSWYAFRLTDKAKARETVSAHVAAINRAQFALIQQYNALKVLQRKSIDPVRSDPVRYINMRPTLPLREPSSPLDLDSLSFLLETDDREFVMHLLIEEQRFETTRQAINERSRVHIEELQPRLAGQIKEKQSYPQDELAGVLGEHLLLSLQRVTDEVVREVDLTLESTLQLSAGFHAAMKKRFPKYKIIGLDTDEPSNMPLQPTSGAGAAG
jgi:hypothetical protein